MGDSTERDPRFRDQPPASRRPARQARPAPAIPEGAERLQKVLADAGVASRRDCELAVKAGRIRVNGSPVHKLPCWVRPGRDLVELDGVVVDTTRRGRVDRSAYVYVAANKPRGVISTARDPEGRPHVVGLVQGLVPRGQRVYPVGRLDSDSTGLVLLTNDGELAHRLAHPRFGVAKRYRVTVQGRLEGEAIARLRRGFYLADSDSIAHSKGTTGPAGTGRRAAIDDIKVIKTFRDRATGDVSLLDVTLREGQNREIRRLLARVGLRVRRLERVAIGPLQLRSLKPGAARRLSRAEVDSLKRAVLLS
jgi:pseudouridine synthase